MNLKNLLMVSTSLVLASAPAFADDAAVGASADATATTPAGGASVGMDANAAASGAATMAWSKSVIDRPLVLAKGKLNADASIDVLRLSFPAVPPITTSTTVTGEVLVLGAGYGVTDKITAGIGYGFSLHSFEIKGPLTLFGAMDIMHNDKLSVGASANLLINLNGGKDAMGNSTVTEALQAGLGVRYKVAPKIALLTGGTAFPTALGTAFGSPFGPLAGSPLGQHLSIGFNSGTPVSFDVPVGVGFQATPELYVSAMTALAHIAIHGGSSSFFAADYIPLNLGALFAVNANIDAGATVSLFDLTHSPFDVLFVGATARYHN